MGYQDNRSDITKYIDDTFPTTIIEQDNVAYEDDQGFTIPTDKPWIRVIIKNIDTNFADIGFPQKTMKRFGMLMIQVFVQEDGGTDLMMQILDQLVTTFEGVQLASGLLFREVKPREAGFIEGWQQANVNIEFDIRESITIVN